MDNNFAIQLFEDRQVRIVWDADAEEYYLSIVDVVQVLTDSVDANCLLEKTQATPKSRGK